jgi:hypothetical protein
MVILVGFESPETLQPPIVNTPANSVTLVQVTVPLDVDTPSVEESDVTTLPAASSTCTCGLGVRSVVLEEEPEGCVTQTSWEGVPAVISKLLLTAEAKDPSVAVSV